MQTTPGHDRMNDTKSLNRFFDLSKFYLDEENYFDVSGSIQSYKEKPVIFANALKIIYSNWKIIFVHRLPLLHCIDLPPPRS
jgi:hypothetical protein